MEFAESLQSLKKDIARLADVFCSSAEPPFSSTMLEFIIADSVTLISTRAFQELDVLCFFVAVELASRFKSHHMFRKTAAMQQSVEK